ncbi:YfhE family protein [Peribacillus sp. SCS-155]|uniref:YfhE family protein n=1 Tax=Peribacillus sedimenti TaxID=3115297 RepID=UPI003905965A
MKTKIMSKGVMIVDKNVPNKGFNLLNNGLSDTQEVLYSGEFKKAYKAEKSKKPSYSGKNTNNKE